MSLYLNERREVWHCVVGYFMTFQKVNALSCWKILVKWHSITVQKTWWIFSNTSDPVW